MVDQDERQSSILGGYRLAIVAGADATIGMARMYQMLTEHNLPHVGVFRAMTPQRAWLGVGAEPSS